MIKAKIAKRMDEYHRVNNNLDTVIGPGQQASISQSLSSQFERSLTLFRAGPTLGFF